MADRNLCEALWFGEAMNEPISAWALTASTASFIQNSKPSLINRESTRLRPNLEQFSYVAKIAALAYLYLELNLSLPVALRAAEADLQ
jgi:hypothetical protein